MRRLLLVVYTLWELPQNCVGALLWLTVRRRVKQTSLEHQRLFFKVHFGVSLGSFVFWSDLDGANASGYPSSGYFNNKAHEFGHAVQSRRLGPLYLLVVGIPSLARVLYGYIYFAFKREHWQGYYAGYPENWADRLGQTYAHSPQSNPKAPKAPVW